MNQDSKKTPNPISIERFRELSDGDAKGFNELIQLYLSKTAEQLQELKEAITQKSAANSARLAHSMVGANAMVGMNTLLPSLRQLEAQAEKEDFSDARETFDIIQSEFKRIQSALVQHVEVNP